MLNADVRKGGGVDQMRTPADKGRGRKRGLFLRTSFMDDPRGIGRSADIMRNSVDVARRNSTGRDWSDANIAPIYRPYSQWRSQRRRPRGTVPQKNLRWGDGPCIGPPNI